MMQFSIEITAVMGALVLAIIWFVRLEAKVMYLEKDHFSHKEHCGNSDKTIWVEIKTLQGTLNDIALSLGRIEGKLGINVERD
jgi:hypothetical protein